MPPQYKLTYFNSRGRAEISRYIFAIAGVEYVDERFEKEDWPKFKQAAPFGQSPTLTIDGQTFCQSYAIGRYLAKKFGLAGKTPMEEFKVDMIVECVRDIVTAMFAGYFETNEAKKAELSEKFFCEQLPSFFSYMEKFLEENKEAGGFFVGKTITVADLAVFNLEDLLDIFQKSEELNKFPKIANFCKHIASQAKIAAWIAKRPKTAM